MELFKAINLIAVFQIIVFIIILAKRHEIKREQKVFLVLFLLSVLYCLMDRTQYFYRIYINKLNFPHFYNSGEPFWYLHLPLLYLYIKSITTSGFKLKWIQFVHALPFIITLVYVLVHFSFLPTEMKNEVLRNNSTIYQHPHKVSFFINILFLQNIYILASYVLVYKYQKQIRSYASSIHWYNVTPLYIAISMFTLMFIIRIVVPKVFKHHYTIPIDLDLTVYAITIIVLGFKQSSLFLNPPRFIDKNPIEKSNSTFKDTILAYMEKEKPHLDPELTLEELAEQMKCNPRKLSQILNNELDINFFTFINKYRIEDAKRLLADREQKSKTVLEILYEVGFNNKSAFNRVFKELTQQTPTQFRKTVLNG